MNKRGDSGSNPVGVNSKIPTSQVNSKSDKVGVKDPIKTKTLFVILLILFVLAIFIIGGVLLVLKYVSFENGGISLGKSKGLILKSAYVEGENVNVVVEENSLGLNLTGIRFTFSDGINDITIERNLTLAENEERTFTFTPAEIPGITGYQEVSIAPIYFAETGEKTIGDTLDSENIRSEAPADTGPVDGDANDTSPTTNDTSSQDIAVPLRSNGAPSGNLASGTTQTVVSLKTNENAVCKYSTSPGINYSSMANTFSTTNGTNHSFTKTGLADGTTYNYYVRCNDSAGNFNTDDYNISFMVDMASSPTPSILLSSSSGNNLTTDDLTATPQNLGSYNTLVYDWKKNGNSIAVLNLPFDTSVNTNSTGAIKDYSDSSNDGTLGNGNQTEMPTWTSNGISGGAYVFDGVDDYIDFGNDASLDLTGDFTILLWFNSRNWSNPYPTFISKRDTFGGMDWQLYYGTSASEIHLYYGNSAANQLFKPLNVDPSLNTWHQLGLTREGSNFSLWIDGQYRGSETATDPFPTGDTLKIGKFGNSPTQSASSKFNGTIDEVKIYTSSLSAEQILAIYNAGTPKYDFLVSQETTPGENWSVAVTPNDVTGDSSTLVSNGLVVL